MKLDALVFPVTVLVGKISIPSETYSELQIGDILVLDQQIEKGLTVKVGYSERYRARAGLFEMHKAITIDEHI